MSQPSHRDATSVRGEPNRKSPPWPAPLARPQSFEARSQPDDGDPFTGPLLSRWADEQYSRLDAKTGELDLWSSIARKLGR